MWAPKARPELKIDDDNRVDIQRQFLFLEEGVHGNMESLSRSDVSSFISLNSLIRVSSGVHKMVV